MSSRMQKDVLAMLRQARAKPKSTDIVKTCGKPVPVSGLAALPMLRPGRDDDSTGEDHCRDEYQCRKDHRRKDQYQRYKDRWYKGHWYKGHWYKGHWYKAQRGTGVTESGSRRHAKYLGMLNKTALSPFSMSR
ncbi:uncharacterized protein B0H64DRAFT_440581 [Chaetomium fimeti]|uniref:Uncharacterized protein n=1 Tax=Chaetomium fimeti TaxID=1854472 RepID=A0AAE0HID1_9PEZI|nr:hypothetical protein B0H64DRAFT_440581 [Chaetomium fimeti]